MNINIPTENIKTETFNDLIAITRDGKQFYSEAAEKVDNTELSSLFQRMARVKSDLVNDLSREVRVEGKTPTTSGTWVGDIQQFYGDVRAQLGDKNYAYVAQLEETEDRLLNAFQKAATSKDLPANVRATASKYLPEVRACHDEMFARKQSLQAIH